MRVSDWKAILSVNPSDALRLQILMWKVDRPSYESWADAVEGCIEHVVRNMAIKKNDIQRLTEDALTAQVTTGLSCFGLNATSGRVGGNVDVVISYADEYIWLGEAKIFTGGAHVWDGYQQLTTRYNTGLDVHSRGGILLYCYKDRADVLLAEWRATLNVQCEFAALSDGKLELTFLSKEDCRGTGKPYSVTHFAFPLLHDPQDGKIKLSPAASAAGRRAKVNAR